MDKPQYVAFMGSVPSLSTTFLEQIENPPDLVVKSYAPFRRFAVQIADDGMDSFGIEQGDFLIFREQRWPTDEGQICLVTFGDEVSIRILEYIYNPEVTLRVPGEKIPSLELAPTDFCVIGVLNGVIKEEFAELIYHEEEDFDWGC
jgi:SOS-response transcriptional repressor LexA